MDAPRRYRVLTQAILAAVAEDRLDELPALFDARDEALASLAANDGVGSPEWILAVQEDARLIEVLEDRKADLTGELVGHFRDARGRQAYRRAA